MARKTNGGDDSTAPTDGESNTPISHLAYEACREELIEVVQRVGGPLQVRAERPDGEPRLELEPPAVAAVEPLRRELPRDGAGLLVERHRALRGRGVLRVAGLQQADDLRVLVSVSAGRRRLGS